MYSFRQLSEVFLQVMRQHRVQRFLLLLCIALACIITTAIVTRISTTVHWSPTQQTDLERDWLFQSSFSELELHDGQPSRWLVTQPKRSDKIINRAIDTTFVRLASAVSSTGFGSFRIRLYSPQPKILTITGNERTVRFGLQQGVRTYTMLVEPQFVPKQTRLYAISSQRFEEYGFQTDTPTQSERDARLLIADFRGAVLSLWPTPAHTAVIWLLACVPLLWLIAVAAYTPTRAHVLLCGIIVYLPWVESLWMHTSATYEPLVTVVVTSALVLSRLIAVRLGIVEKTKSTPLWIYVILSSIFADTRVLPASQWMIGVDFARFPTWSEFLSYLLVQRAAFPIPLLTVEYALSRVPTWWLYDVGYSVVLMRWAAVASLLAALSGIRIRRSFGDLAKHLMLILIALGISFIYRYDDRNYWMAYDACIGLALVVVFRLFRSPLDRPRLWLSLACAIVVADSLRPYMQLFVPAFVGVAAIRIWRLAGMRGIILFCIPLTYTLVWHSYHVVVLEQWSWSNYAGFNIARAWLPDAYAAAVRGLPPDMQNPLWGERSSALTGEVFQWIRTNPARAFERALKLLWQMLQIPVTFYRFTDAGETYEVTRLLPWYIMPFRIAVFLLLGMQFLTFAILVRHFRKENYTFLVERVIWITIFCVTAVSETGEQARFLASFVPVMLLGLTDVSKIIDWNGLRRLFNRFTTAARQLPHSLE
jgi:hypothetical protein